MTLYKYKRLENLAYFLDIIVRKRLYGATIKELNDPMEGYFSSEEFNSEEWEHIKKLKKEVRICSLSTNKDNALLWAHYANEHKGCCVEVDVAEDISWKRIDVNYCSSFPILHSGLTDDEVIEILFKTKSDFWSYEDEVRFVKRLPLSKDEKPHKANLPVKVMKIYLGVRVTAEEKDRIVRIVNAIDSNIIVEKMKRKEIKFWRDQSIYSDI
jgi:hypothetical protein